MIAEGALPQLLMVAAIAIMIVVLMRRSNRYFARRDKGCSASVGPARADSSSHSLSDTPQEVAKWEVQMHEVARDLSGQLDSKMGALAQLIRDADRAAARLEKALAAIEPESPISEKPRAASQADERTASDQAERLKNANLPLAETTSGCNSGGGRDRACLCEEIYTLSDYGLPAAEIAQRVGSLVGEVELILGLRDKH